MSRFFFDVHDGTDRIDREGLELPDLDTARLEVLRLVSDFTDRVVSRSILPESLIIRVHTEDGRTVYTAKLRFEVPSHDAMEQVKSAEKYAAVYQMATRHRSD